MYAIRLTHRPSSTFGSSAPEAVQAHTYFAGFRARTGRRAASLYGPTPEVRTTTGRDWERKVQTWVKRETAETNLHHLIARGWKGQVVTY